MSISIRLCETEDAEFILSLVARFSEFPLPHWRTAIDLERANRAALQKALEQAEDGAAIFVAVEASGQRAGFIHLQTEPDFFTGEKCGYISEVAVDPTFEGQGVGSLLLARAEEWCAVKGYRLLTLYVFAANTRAQRLYERLGFRPEATKYVKQVAVPPS